MTDQEYQQMKGIALKIPFSPMAVQAIKYRGIRFILKKRAIELGLLVGDYKFSEIKDELLRLSEVRFNEGWETPCNELDFLIEVKYYKIRLPGWSDGMEIEQRAAYRERYNQWLNGAEIKQPKASDFYEDNPIIKLSE